MLERELHPLNLSPRSPLPQETPYEVSGFARLRMDLVDLELIQSVVGWRPCVRCVVNDTMVSVGRDWHQEQHPYRADRVPPRQASVFLALGHCPEGSIEFAVGSHHWPVAEIEEIQRAVGLNHRGERAEAALRPIVVARLRSTYRPVLKVGDALVWHPWLWHRSDPGVVRNALVLRVEVI